MEMNGILKNNSKDTTYQQKFIEVQDNAIILSQNILYSLYRFKSDDHFMYLKAKRKNKVISLKNTNSVIST